ncbi:MAG: FkbM family methyltransferase [Pseudomonadota bacterium]
MRLSAKLTGRKKFFGFSYAARAVRTFLPSKRVVQAKMGDGFVFAFPYGDAYWGRLFDNSQFYEPDVRAFLCAVSDVDYAFIDCGANFGYHSCFTNSRGGGEKPTVAIEADHQNFEVLRHNRELNGERIEIRHNAIHATSGMDVTIFGTKHEAFSIVEQDSIPRGVVKTLAIGSLADWLSSICRSKVIVKLDVEGVEAEAIDGIGSLGDAEVLIIYEDHGSDDEHTPTKHLMKLGEYRIFIFKNGCVEEISELHELDQIKENRRYGYDFIATKSEFWLNKLSALD